MGGLALDVDVLRLAAEHERHEGAVDVAERVRRLRERHVEQEQPASDNEPIRRSRPSSDGVGSLDFYVTADRTRGGIRQSMLEEIYVAISVPVKFLIHTPPDS